MADDEARQAIADALFSEIPTAIDLMGENRSKNQTETKSWKSECWRLEKLKEKELRKWWEATSLKKYLEVERIPRGLRIFTVPSYENPDPLMLKAWREHTHRSSLGMLEILITFAWSDREKLLKEIATIETELKRNETETAKITEHISQMNKRLEKVEEDIKQRKARKFARDREDYLSGQILTFARKFVAPRRDLFKAKNQKDTTEMGTTSYETEVSSEGDTSEEENMDKLEGTKIDFLDEHRLLQQVSRPQYRGRGRGRGNAKTDARGERSGGLEKGEKTNPPSRQTRSK